LQLMKRNQVYQEKINDNLLSHTRDWDKTSLKQIKMLVFITKKISTSIFISSGENGIFSVLMAVYFLIFIAINANPISFCPLYFPRTDIRVKPKLAFKNPKKGSTSILRFP